MTADEYRDALSRAYIAAALVRGIRLGAMLDAINRAESIGPITDPSLFRDRGAAMSQDKSVVVILREAQLALDRLPWPDRDRMNELASAESSPAVPPRSRTAPRDQEAL